MLMKSIVFAAIVMAAASQAFARQSATCSGGHLYLEQTLPNGEEVCWDTKLTCSGEWSYSWERVISPGPSSQPVLATGKESLLSRANRTVQSPSIDVPTGQSISVSTPTEDETFAEQATAKLAGIKETDLVLVFRAPAPIVIAFKLRAGWPTKSNGHLVLGKNAGPTLPAAPAAYSRGRRYPPHGYPCLGCYPCGDSYCDNDNKRLTKQDLSPQVAAEGYVVRDGKIVRARPRGR